MDGETRRVLEGCLDELPAEESSSISLFFSSTFTDMTTERNYILNDIIPEVRARCHRHGLDLQTIDMRWGVRDEASVDHTTTEIVLSQVIISRELSKGPYFVSFLGDRYGSRVLPHYIEASEYKLLRRIAMKLGSDISLMDQWFARDDNAEPTVYYLRNITDILTHYSDDSPENEKLQVKEKKEWDKINNKLIAMFRRAADYAYEEKLISKETRHVYFKSVTEAEVEEGVLFPANVKDKVIVYERALQNVDLKDDKAWRFIDMKDGEIDREAEDLRERLKITKVEPRLGPGEIRKFTVDWRPGGIDVDYGPHKEYLEDLCQDFKDRITRMIDVCTENDKEKKAGIYYPLCKEHLSHLKFCEKKSEIFCGRDELLDDIKQRFSLTFTWKEVMDPNLEEESTEKQMNGQDGRISVEEDDKDDRYREEMKTFTQRLKDMGVKFCSGDLDNDLDSDPNRNMKAEFLNIPPITTFGRPVFLYGESGSGKTAVMAKLAYKVKEWYPSCVSIVRFMGTTPFSSMLRSMLIGVCTQISMLYGVTSMLQADLEQDFHYLCQYFNALLWRINCKERPLVIILDSVDQLASPDDPYNMKWIPCQLPPNVHMIISMIPNICCCLENTLQNFPHPDMYVEIPLLTSDAAEDIILETCRKNRRRLTRMQARFLVEKFSSSPYPLYLKLLLDSAMMWRSDKVPKDKDVGSNMKEAIYTIFDMMESKHGKILIQKAFALISASLSGISKMELEDALSLDDEVLQDTYLYHLPPNPDKIRIPYSILALLMTDIDEYIVTRSVGHVKIMRWYHRHFAEACRERYFYPSIRKDVHCHLASYFEGYWYDRVKPLELYKVKKGSYPNAKRNVQAQPIKFMEHLYNFRKILEYPYHLIMSGQFEKYIEQCLCNFEFLYAQAKVQQVTALLLSLQKALTTMDEHGDISECHTDLETVYNIISLESDCLRKDINQLAILIISRLGPDYKGSKHLEQLVRGAQQWIQDCDVALLLPCMLCAPSPGGILQSSFSAELYVKGDSISIHHGSKLCLHEKQNHLLAIQRADSNTVANSLHIFDLNDNGSCLSIKKLDHVWNAIWIYCDNKYIHLINDEKNREELYEVSSSTPVQFPYPQDCLTVSQTGNMLAFSSVSKIYVCKIGRSIHHLTTIQTVDCEEAPVRLLLISPDEKYLAAIVDKHEDVIVFDIATGLTVYRSPKKEGFALGDTAKSLLRKLSMITKENKLIVKERQDIALVNLETREKTQLRSCTGYTMNVVTVHVREQFVAVGTKESTTVSTYGSDKAWKVWDIRSGEVVTTAHKSLYNSCGVITLVLFGQDHLFAAVGLMYDSAISLAYLGTLSSPNAEAVPHRRLQGHSDLIRQFVLKSDQSFLISSAEDNRLNIWNLNKVVSEFCELYGPNPESSKILADYEENIKQQSNTTNFAISSNDREVYMVTTAGQLIVHDLEKSKVTKKLEVGADIRVDFVLASRSGKFIITAPRRPGSQEKNVHIKIWNSTSYDLCHALEHRTGVLSCMAEANDILVAGTVGMEAKAAVWNINTGEVLKTFELLYSLQKVAINSTGTMIVSTFFECPICISVYEENGPGLDMGNLDSMMSGALCLDISQDDRMALSGSSDGQIRVLELSNHGKYLNRMAQKSSVIAAKFTPDSLYVVSTGFKSVYIWNLRDGNLRLKLKKHNDFVVNIQFDRLGKYMISSGRDKKIVYWDLSTFISLASYYTHCQVDTIGLTSDGDKVIYIPENVGHISILYPNKKLQEMKQQDKVTLRQSLLKAQAMALSFSSQKMITHQRMSSACSLM